MTDYRIWPSTNGPNSDAGDPNAPVNLGLFFQVSQTAWVKAIHMYRGALTITGPAKGRVFLVSTQTVVTGTAVDFTLSGIGWQTASLPTPIQIAANTLYKVVLHTDDNYSATGGYWATGVGVGGVTNGILTAPDAGGTPLGVGALKQDSFTYTSNPDTYPDSYFQGGNYWVDVTVTDTDPSHSGTGTAPLSLAASGVGSKQATGTGTAGLALATSGTSVHHGVNAGTATFALAASAVGVHHGVGTGIAPLTLAAHGATISRDISLIVGRLATGWATGALATSWSTGQMEDT